MAERLLRQSLALDPSPFFVDIESGNVCLKRGGVTALCKLTPTHCNTFGTIPNSRARLRNKSNGRLQNRRAKSLNREIRFWSDSGVESLSEAQQGEHLRTNPDKTASLANGFFDV
jgi:hypothetical protein